MILRKCTITVAKDVTDDAIFACEGYVLALSRLENAAIFKSQVPISTI